MIGVTGTGFARYKYTFYGLALVLVIVLFTGVCIAAYAKLFKPTSMVYVRTERAGLQMYPGNRVQLRGVDVGEVGDVRSDGAGGVEIALKMDPETLALIPANVNVQLSQLTAFGAKTVSFAEPEAPTSERLRPGTVLSSDRQTVEVNNLLEKLTEILDTAEPAKVSSVLGGLAQTLDGRGEQLGETATKLADYLRRFNGNLPALQQDLHKTGEVADVYAAAMPELAGMLENVRHTSRTVVEQQAQLDGFLFQLTRFSKTGNTFFATNGPALSEVSSTALPTSELLRRYSPEYTCFISGLAETNRRLLTQQGNTVPGFVGNTTLEPGVNSYRYPEDLPVVGADNGPDCAGLPYVHGDEVPAAIMKDIDKGGEPNPTGSSDRLSVGDQPLVAQLFGPGALVPPDGGKPPEQSAGGNTSGTNGEGP